MATYIHGSSGEGLIYLLIGGPFLLMGGLRRLREKRLIENLATSKIHSAALGLVELCGRAKPRTAQKAPVSQVDCCWWKCRVEEYRSSGKNSHWATVLEKESNDFFFLEDPTGQVLVNPAGAEIKVPKTVQALTPALQAVVELWGVQCSTWLGGTRRMRIIEELIVANAPLYVMGQLSSIGDAAGDQKARLLARLRAAKSNPVLMQAADSDRDGQIDAAEWDALRTKLEQSFYQEELSRPQTAPLLMVLAPSDNPFLISAGSERDFLRSYRWLVPIMVGGGIAASALGCWWAVTSRWNSLFIVGLLAVGVVVGTVFQKRRMKVKWGNIRI